MKKESNAPHIINSISEQHRLLSLPKPQHPLISVFNYKDIQMDDNEMSERFMLNFYCIAIKKNFKGKLKYGQNYYDFDEGVMSFISPNQLLSKTTGDDTPVEGCCLIFHPDLIRNYALAKTIKSYGLLIRLTKHCIFQRRRAMIESIFANIEQEYKSSIDNFNQDVIVSHIELLLKYSNRFYNRQFITRKHVNNDLLIKLEMILSNYFNDKT